MKVDSFIDSHNHIYSNFTLDEMELVLKTYNIRLCIVSDVTSGVDNPKDIRTASQTIEANMGVYNSIKTREFLKGQFYFDCRFDVASTELFKFLLNNRDVFVGIKIHSHISQTPADSHILDDILNFAQANKLPVMFHTDSSDLCGLPAMQNVIDRFPHLILVLGHCFLDVPVEDVCKFLMKNKQVFGETSWASVDKVMELLNVISSERLMFGTDAPVDGELGRGTPLEFERSCFKWYNPLFEKLKQLSDKDYNNFMVNTALEVYGLKIR